MIQDSRSDPFVPEPFVPRSHIAKRFWAAVAVATLLLVGCEKARLDEEVRLLCAKDGGTKIYETIGLSPEKFDRYGEVKVLEKQYAKPSDDFFYVWDVTFIKNGNPSLKRNNFKLYRQVDRKLLAEGIGYVRSGGDLPGPWHESAYHCPDTSEYSIKFLAKQVFIKEKTKETVK